VHCIHIEAWGVSPLWHWALNQFVVFVSFHFVLLIINIDLINFILADLIDFRWADQQFNDLWVNALALLSIVWHRSCSAWWQRNLSSYSSPTRKRRFPAHLALNLAFKPWIPPVRHLQILILLVHLLKLMVLMWTTCTTNSIKRNACWNVWKVRTGQLLC